jgi:TolB-like protein/DNA-binding winged helix-turn-helix (wHTH) protein/Tfp pilus assembly protein PilF
MEPTPIRFGDDFELDRRSQKLSRAGRTLKLERIPTEILVLLIEKNGETVSREQIIERIWGNGVFLDTDNSINGAIRKIRQALKDDPEQPQFIQTVTGWGYRFIAPVIATTPSPEAASQFPSPVQSPAVQPVSEVAPEEVSPTGVRAGGTLARGAFSRRHLGLVLGLVVGFVLLLCVALGVYFQSRRSTSPAAPAGRAMLAVLPFENFTGDAAQDYFSDGLTEEMISQLGNLDPAHLGIIARTSVMHYKHAQEPLTQIAKELGVQYVIEGSVRRDAGRVRITAQLIQTKDQTHIWARQYDRDLNNLLALQSEIAREIANEIEFSLSGRRPIDAAPTASQGPNAYEAYDLYLRGRFFWNKRTLEGFREAIDYFQQAIAKDPGYARAYAGLADSYALLGGYGVTPQTESMPKARAAALKALELDGSLAEAHTSLALITENFDFDWAKAEQEYRRAIELNPSYATAHQWYAEYLALQGRFDEALAESERARALDPLSLIIGADKGAILYYARRYDEAIAQFRGVREMEPDFPRAQMMVSALVEKGEFTTALAEFEKSDDRRSEAWTWAWRAYVYGRGGQHAQAQQALERVKQSYKRRPTNPDPMLWALLGAGERNETFVWFEKAFADHSNLLTTLKVNPAFDSVRDDARFEDVMRRVRFTQ